MKNHDPFPGPVIAGCLGDSLTDGYPDWSSSAETGHDEMSCYQYWLLRLAESEFPGLFSNELGGLRFLNCGICGQVTGQIGARLHRDILDGALRRFGRFPHLVIIVAGTNDLGWSAESHSIVANITSMHLACWTKEVFTVGSTIPPSAFETDPEYSERKQAVNHALVHFFESENIPFADLFSDMGNPHNLGCLRPELDAGDGLHFSPAGYRAMAESLWTAGIREYVRQAG